MEQQQNLPIIAKRLWSIARVVYFMLKKTLSKRKLLLADMRVFLNRGKALAHLLISTVHHSRPHRVTDRHVDFQFVPTRGKWARAHAPPPPPDEILTVQALRAAIEMMSGEGGATWSVEASPAMPGFGPSPRVAARGLRVTDSPYPMKEADEDSVAVDRAAEEFIKRFYRELKEQKRS